jgi:hypothetical protein
MKYKLFLVLLAVIAAVAFAWLSPNAFRSADDRETKAATREQEIRKIQREYNVDYAEALEIFTRRQRER